MEQQRAVVYCRVSSAVQEEGFSLDTQEARCRSYCRERGYEVVQALREVGGGDNLYDRPALTEARDLIRRGEAGVLVAFALDRLTRNQAHLGVILSEADYTHARLEFVTERWEDTPEGRLLVAVRGFVAEVEREKIRERTNRGKAARVAEGKYPAGKAPYGYTWADPAPGEKTTLMVDEDTAPIVRGIFRDVANGISARKVALALNDRGVPTSSGKGRWVPKTIANIIHHPVYEGDLRANRWRTEKVNGKGTVNKARPPEDHLVFPDHVPAIVSRELAAAARVRLGRNKIEATRNLHDPERFLLRGGFARCGYCGNVLRTAGLSRTYACNQANRDRYGCPGFVVTAHILDDAVWEKVEAVLTRPEIIAAELERMREEDPTRDDLGSVERRIGEIARKQRNLVSRLADADDPDVVALIQGDLTALGNQKRQLEEDRARLAGEREAWEQAQGRMRELEAWCRDVAANLGELGYEQKRLALTALGVEARVWSKDHDPRFEITMGLSFVEPTTRRCSAGRCRTGAAPSRARSGG